MATRDLAGAGIVALGLAAGGLFVGSGFARMRTSDRYVTVKGISEREVKADLAIWPLHRRRGQRSDQSACSDREQHCPHSHVPRVISDRYVANRLAGFFCN